MTERPMLYNSMHDGCMLITIKNRAYNYGNWCVHRNCSQ